MISMNPLDICISLPRYTHVDLSKQFTTLEIEIIVGGGVGYKRWEDIWGGLWYDGDV